MTRTIISRTFGRQRRILMGVIRSSATLYRGLATSGVFGSNRMDKLSWVKAHGSPSTPSSRLSRKRFLRQKALDKDIQPPGRPVATGARASTNEVLSNRASQSAQDG